MQYITTRNKEPIISLQEIVLRDRARDGGYYIPLEEPAFTQEELIQLKGMSFSERIAYVLNLLFETNLEGWDIDFAIGRRSIRQVPLRNSMIIWELWHNPGWCVEKMEKSLTRVLRQNERTLIAGEDKIPTNWVKIAIRIAMLSAVCLDCDNPEMDVSMLSGDFLWPIAAWYARKWGIPIGNIVICCNENQNLWELLCHGQMRTDTVSAPTFIPGADIPVPGNLERLIHSCGGHNEVRRYVDCRMKGLIYIPDEPILNAMRQGLYVSVVSSNRLYDTIPAVLKTHNCYLAPGAALAYAGLQDYRAKKSTQRPALIIADRSPMLDSKIIEDIMDAHQSSMMKHF